MISFVVPAYNEETLLGQTLTSIRHAAQALAEPFEIVVVDDASTDRTAEIARQHDARVISVQLRQISATRNAGARAATGEMLIFVDADTVVTAGAVKGAVQAMQQGAAGGGCHFIFEGRIPLHGRILIAVCTPIYRWLKLASGCFLFCTRTAYEAVGGFNEELFAAEEGVMSRRLGQQGRFVILNETVTTSGRKLRSHSLRETFGVLARIAFTGGKAAKRRQGLDIWYGDRRLDPGQ